MLGPTPLLRRVKKLAKNIGRVFSLDFFSFEHGNAGTYEPGPGAGSAQTKMGINGWTMRVFTLVLLQVGLGLTRDGGNSSSKANGTGNTPLSLKSISTRFIVLDTLKLAFCVCLLYYVTRQNSHSVWSPTSSASAEMEEQLLTADEALRDEVNTSMALDAHSVARPLLLGSLLSYIAIGVLALILVGNSYLMVYVANSGDVNTFVLHFSTFLVPLLSAVFLRLLGTWTGSSQQWLGIIFQILGRLSFENQSSLPEISSSSIIFLITLGLLASLTCISIHHVYNRHSSIIPSKFNTRLFACGLLAHLSILILSNLISTSSFFVSSQSTFRSFISLLLRASVDIASLNIIYDCGPVLYAITTSLSAFILLAWSGCADGSTSIGELSGLLVALLGFCVYCTGESHQQGPAESYVFPHKKTLPSSVLLSAVSFLLLGTLVYIGSSVSAVQAEPESHEPGLLGRPWTQSSDTAVFTDLSYILRPPLPPPEPTCIRIPLSSEQFFSGNRTYHEFDDVLLIVFFSHARYDVNLDYYKEVYSEFFPNMVFVGPRTREDKGFKHSYDVLVDSYDSDEDISDWSNYKMAGRMAHHMLYTVLTTPPYSTNCYKGFLWAPFDTLLNVPRLQLFDKERIWYFSPWGEYVTNPALDEGTWMNASNHAPPARISPDPETNFEETYRGWWVDWWWGDPHYGIPVCKFAFENVPLELRDRMAQRFTDNETRYIGGSADTLYVPARLADEFVNLLGIFLNTSCFLEIAVPTVVHLLVPEDENILFVDHWWIWDPPFNASFVRDRWKRGMEVDTFHTFHWGDKSSDGVWRANLNNIEDVRLLLEESAARQGIPWVSS